MTLRRRAAAALCAVALASATGGQVTAQDRLSGRAWATRSEVMARHGMVATSHPLATQIALEILKEGGTAVDAAIAANAFLGLGDPGNSGMGGDLFAIVWDAKTKQLHGLNASGRSPRGMTLAALQAKKLTQIPVSGPLAVSVPGCVDGWFSLHGKFGKLPMTRLLAPTIAYAREGIPMTSEVTDNMADYRLQGRLAAAGDTIANFRKVYQPTGAFPKKGDVFRNPALADSLEAVSRGGRDAYYKGPIAAAIAAHVKARGGFLSTEDFAQHTSEWVTPISTTYRGYQVY
ncbi:MAG TPA: gamma-glutamyltransferase, partial [Luteitalea sp.]|nr:gamma-glutamyltransferase [Luteitalea sp.]